MTHTGHERVESESEKLLVSGVDTCLGGNLAVWLADRFEVVGLSGRRPVGLERLPSAGLRLVRRRRRDGSDPA